MKNISIFSVSAGVGHIRAAQAIESAAKKTEKSLQVKHLDLMTLVPDLFRKLYAGSYIKMVENHPNIWGYIYRKADREKPDSLLNKIRKAVQKLNLAKFEEEIEKSSPDVIICTHFLPAEILSAMVEKNGLKCPVYVAVTDFDVHAMWVHPFMTAYLTASEEVAFRLADRGVKPDQIHVTGIPINPVFSGTFSKEECAKEIGIYPDRFTILMMSGGAGLEGLESLVKRLAQMEKKFQIIALAGKNEDLLKRFTELSKSFPDRIKPMGFTNTIEKLMAASDIAVTKPGGLTTSECLAMGLPMILVSPIPGQEERNADYLLENGAAMKATDPAGLEFKINKVMNNPELIQNMHRRAIEISRPNAAMDILKIVLG
ncbi:MAG: glycosyltransferase [Candidatus Riflebacteria bacterium]|nr:glycosyltransferase [Candidatus Riflebacteria bacterium]